MTKKAVKPTTPYLELRCLKCGKRKTLYSGYCWDCADELEEEKESREDTWG